MIDIMKINEFIKGEFLLHEWPWPPVMNVVKES